MAKTGSKLVFDCVEIPQRRRSHSMRPSLSANSSSISSSRSTNLTTPSASPGPSSRVKREVVEEEDRAALFAEAEEEDVKPDLAARQEAAMDRTGRRQSSRRAATVNYAEVPLDDDEQVRRRVREETADDDFDEEKHKYRVKRRRMSKAPSAMPQQDADDKDAVIIKTEEELQAYRDTLALQVEQARNYARPAELLHPSINIFKPSTFDVEPALNVCDADTQATLALGAFKRVDLGGPLVATGWSGETRTKLYDTPRICLKQSVNFGCRGPGKAFVWTCSPFDVSAAEEEEVFTVFVRDRSNKDSEPWRPYGKYKFLWCGLADHDEFAKLGAEGKLQKDVIDAFMTYLRGRDDEYPRWVFENTFVPLDPLSPVETEIWDSRKTAPRQAQRAAIERSLRENRGLQIGYGVMVWHGPISEDEVRDIVAKRDERWEVEYQKNLVKWKAECKEAKAKGHELPPKPVKGQKAKKAKKAAKGKGKKAAAIRQEEEQQDEEQDEDEDEDEAAGSEDEDLEEEEEED